MKSLPATDTYQDLKELYSDKLSRKLGEAFQELEEKFHRNIENGELLNEWYKKVNHYLSSKNSKNIPEIKSK